MQHGFLRSLFVCLCVLGRLAFKVFTLVLGSHFEVLVVVMGVSRLWQEPDNVDVTGIDQEGLKKFGG